MIVLAYSLTDGRYIRSANAQADQMNPGEMLIPGYHTPDRLPDPSWLQDGEYFAYLDENSKPPRRWQDGAWEIRKEQHPITAWLKSDCTKSKQFDDASEVTDGYTTEKPTSRWDIWIDSGWQTDEQAKFESEVQAINNLRRQQYAQIVDPLMNEARMQRMLGDDAGADKNEQQAQEWYMKIKQDNPWPPAPLVE
ncbi:hypothetical protein [Photobacterium sp. 1_MG-2023]|uniref:hypothetical protein n=1 Tax=Photobacterium sp. 1_MG-2023 TaxID=3062646 RepID=UPI0026E32D1B|nr:hypothetical protein [Photobacterium sp. 1_MG-2023]MDO6706135.1 hypothetical protein [Photobacterium sp. 1_MG-2023]